LREAAAQFGQQAEEMQNLVYEQPTTLQPAADALGLKIIESDWITQEAGEGITGKRVFIDASFSADVIQEGLNSDVLELDENNLVAIRNIEHRQPQLKPFDDVAEDIRQQLKLSTLHEFATVKTADMVSSLKEGRKTLDELAEQLELSLVTSTDLGRVGKDDLSPALVNAIFDTAVAKDSGDKAAASVKLDDNTIAVFAVRKITPGDPANAVAGVRDQMRSILEQRKGNGLFADYEQGLREKAKVTVYEDKL
jgi:peptidyl-prolyl cis-trans isomerase D